MPKIKKINTNEICVFPEFNCEAGEDNYLNRRFQIALANITMKKAKFYSSYYVAARDKASDTPGQSVWNVTLIEDYKRGSGKKIFIDRECLKGFFLPGKVVKHYLAVLDLQKRGVYKGELSLPGQTKIETFET